MLARVPRSPALAALLLAAAALLSLGSCGGGAQVAAPDASTPPPARDAAATPRASPAATPTPAPPRLALLVTAGDIDAEHMPVARARSFPSDAARIYAVAHFAGEAAARVTARWYAVDADGYAPGALLLEQSAWVRGGDRYGFALDPPASGFALGAYRVDLAIAGRLAGSAEFVVRGPEGPAVAATPAGPPPPTPTPGADGLVALLARGVTERHEPIGATTVFAPDTERIYLVFTATGMPTGSRLEARWVAVTVAARVPPNHEIDRSTLTVQGNVPGSFWLSRPRDGFPTGRYRVELYLNGTLIGAYPFRVE